MNNTLCKDLVISDAAFIALAQDDFTVMDPKSLVKSPFGGYDDIDEEQLYYGRDPDAEYTDEE